jgi:hypothetical protein
MTALYGDINLGAPIAVARRELLWRFFHSIFGRLDHTSCSVSNENNKDTDHYGEQIFPFLNSMTVQNKVYL